MGRATVQIINAISTRTNALPVHSWNNGYRIFKHPSLADIVSNYALAQHSGGQSLLSPTSLHLEDANIDYLTIQDIIIHEYKPVLNSTGVTVGPNSAGYSMAIGSTFEHHHITPVFISELSH